MPNFSRKDMPQVTTQNMSKALDRVADKVKLSKQTISASKLKKSQKELYKDKVKGIASKFSSPNSMKPLVISKDNHIVDGHHRWAAAIYKWGEDVKIPIYRIHLNAVNAIKLYSMIASTIEEVVKNITEGVWSKSALAAMHRKPMPGRYFISDENGNVVERGLKTRRSWSAYLHNMGKMGGSLSYYHGTPKVVNIHDGKKDNEVVDQYYWIDKYGNGRYSIDIDNPTAGSHSKIDPKLINYKEIEKQLGLKEAINIPISVGDTILGGKFKNKRIVVKSIGKNEKGDITINGKPLLKYRLLDEGLILEGNGDCYQAAVNVLMRNMDKGTLVHGMVNGHGRLEGIRFGHAWVEIGNKVLDYSNGNKVTMPKKAYYALGRVNPNECKYYKYKKAAQFMLNRGHYGPWEMSGDTVMAEDIPDSKGEIGKKKVKVSKDIMNNLDTLEEAAKRDYKKEYEKYGKSEKAKKYRAELNKYNRDKGTYGNGDGKDASHKGGKIVGFEDESKNRGRREKSRLKKESPINEIPMDDLQKIDTFADKKLNPVDVVITDKHFFDRLNDPRNGKEITSAELIGFFKRLSKHKKDFVEFLNKYNSVVAVDDRTNINIPFMKQANKAIAKTVMRKKDFKSTDKKLDI